LISCCVFAPFAAATLAACSFGHGHLDALCPGMFNCCLLPPKSESGDSFNGGVYIVTGGNRGVGFHTAKILLNRGFNVIILSRSAARGEEAASSLKRLTRNNNCKSYQVDLNDLNSIHKFVEVMESQQAVIHSLVNNAGAISMESMQSNHFGHFALTLGLLPGLRRGSKGGKRVTVVNVSSIAQWDGSAFLGPTLRKLEEALMRSSRNTNSSESTGNTNAIFDITEELSKLYGKSNNWPPYAQSKAANAVFGFAMMKILKSLENEGIICVSVHPGVMLTDLWRAPGEIQTQNNAANTTMTSPIGSGSNSRVTSGDVQQPSPVAAATSGNFDHSRSRNQSATSSHAAADSGGESARSWVRAVTCCCVKHPIISAVGISALAAPRLPFECCCFSQPKSALSSCTHCVQTYCFTGSDGGYFQQCLCCCVLPVRASPLLYSRNLESLLWKLSLEYIKYEHPLLAEFIESHNSKIEYDPSKQRLMVSSALPCSEICGLAPYNVCWTCFC
jgi:NAD(P)-dependent dehydrogenase (short-subunit alcohol dehydrogenase family)